MKTDKDYAINESNDTGEEHAKLVLSRIAQNPDMSLNDIVKETVPEEFAGMLMNCFEDLIKGSLKFL